MHKRYQIVLGVLMGLSVAGLTYANDSATTTNTNTTETTSVTRQDSTQVQQAGDMKWTELKGRVQHVDLTNNIVQIKEKGSDKLIEVPITGSVHVMDSSNHTLALGDLKEGQKVVIRND